MQQLKKYCSVLNIGLCRSGQSLLVDCRAEIAVELIRLIARLPRYSSISTYVTGVLHLLPVASRIQYKLLLLVLRTQQGLAPKYLWDLMHKPLSGVSSRLLRSAHRLDLHGPTPCLCYPGSL